MVDLRPAFPLGIVLIIWHMIHPIVNLHFDNNNFFVNILYYLIHDLIALSAAILLYAILCAIFVFIDVTYVRPFHYASSDSRKLTKDEYYRVYGPKVNDTGAAQKKWTTNFRSLEGLRAEDGRTIKSNTVYRCDAIKDALLDTSNLRFQDPKTIIDLRAISESKASPTILPQRSESKVINLPVMPLTKDEQQKRKITGIGSITKILMCEPQLLLGDVHRPRLDEMAVFAIERLILEPKYADGAVKNFIKLAADKSNHPVCWHCTEGKDRSGALAALLLVALGVPIQDVISDFALSNKLLYERAHKRFVSLALFWLLNGRWMSYYKYADRAKRFLFVDPMVLERCFATVHNTYGGFNTKYWKAQGLTEKDIKNLQGVILA